MMDEMPRVLLVLPTATYRADAFLAAARRLGVEVTTASDQAQVLADVMGDRFVRVPLEDPDAGAAAIAALDGRRALDAVVAVDDQGLLTAAAAAARLGLAHNPPDALRATRDKAEMRTRLAAAEVPQPEFTVCTADDGDALVAAVERAARRRGGPVVVKPTGLSASRGVIRADAPDGAGRAARRIAALLAGIGEPLRVVVERYVPGDEVALEGLLSDGVLSTLAVFDKPDPLVGPFFEETIYTTPSLQARPVLDALEIAVAQAVAALGLRHGPLHAEARLERTPAGVVPRILEVAARTIGGRCAAALSFATGTTLEEVVLAHALGRGTDLRPSPGASGVMMIPIPATGRLVGVEGRERAGKVPLITGLEITVPPGGRVVALPEGDRYLGFLFARGQSPGAVADALRAAHGELEIHIDPDPGQGAP